MSNNYPPGVTGNEKEIRGQSDIEWDHDTFEKSGMLDDYTAEGTVYGYRGKARFTALATKVGDEVEVNEEYTEFDCVMED